MSTDRMPSVYLGHGAPPPVGEEPARGLDHGAYVPLTVMYPQADVPVLQISMPSLSATQLLTLGRQLAPLRDEGVLIMGSGFLTHGLPFLTDFRPDAPPPGWSKEFDALAAETLARGAVDARVDYRRPAPAPTATAPGTAGPVAQGTWSVGDTSKATVRVREQLVGVSAPSDAVLVATGATGSFTLNVDGTFTSDSKISFDLTTLTSD